MSQCEAESLAMIANELDQKYGELSVIKSPNSEIADSQHSIMYGFARLWNSMASNITLLGNPERATAVASAENGSTTLNFLNISISTNSAACNDAGPNPESSNNILQLSPAKLSPGNEIATEMPAITLMPVKLEEENTDDAADGAYYTSVGQPDITPRHSRALEECSLAPNQLLTPHHDRSNRARSRSECLATPYPTPTDISGAWVQMP